MLIRHAEKPVDSHGVTFEGARNKGSLSVRGWQRAGALACLLSPSNDFVQEPLLAAPRFLYASRPQKRNGSFRPLETVMPLAEKMALSVNTDFAKYDFEPMLEAAGAHRDTVLICWQHEFLPKIANLILGDAKTVPQAWAESRFDLIWIFDRDEETEKYSFRQVPQRLLAGDLSEDALW